MGKLSETIDSRLKELGITGSKMCDDLHMSRSTITELRKGRASTLKAEKAAAIASYLGLSVEELLGIEKPAAESDSELDKQLEGIDFALYGEVKDLTEAQKKDVLQFVKFLKQKE